jgi:GPH family glycoside/pentoside/hexuronide:cation symporter
MGLGSVGIYFARDVLGDANLYGLMSAVMMVPMLIGTPIMPALYKKFGKRNVMLAGALLSLAAGGLQLVWTRVLPVYLLLSAIKGFGSIMTSASIFTLASDIVEYTEWKTGMRTEGLVTSVNSFGIKVGTGVGSALVGWVLALGGYDAALTAQPQGAVNAMIALMIIIPMVFSLLIAILLLFWDIDKFRPQIERALGKKQAIDSVDVLDSEARVIEEG